MIAKYGQSLLDLQLIAAGNLEGMKQLWDNNDLPITAELEDGQTLTMGDTADPCTVRSYANSDIEPATALDEEAMSTLGGIGYMRVGIDFIVS